MHRKLRCDRHRNLRAPCTHRVANALQVVVRPSSELVCILQSQNNLCIASCGTTVIATCAHFASKGSPTHRKLWCDRHRNLRAPCKRSVANASQVVMRLSSQLARTLHTQGRQRIVRCGATVIATSGAHVIATSGAHCSVGACSRHAAACDYT